MSRNENEIEELWATLVTRSWEDPHLRRRLLEEPAAVLHESGVAVPEGATIKTFEDDGNTIVMPVAQEPEDTELAEEQLASVAGGIIVIEGGRSALPSIRSFGSLQMFGR